MYTHADKSQENKNRSVADSLSKQRGNNKLRSGVEAVIQGKFETDWGEFDQKHLSVRKEEGNEVGVEIFISYDPGEKTDAAAIGLTQVVRSSQQKKPFFLSQWQEKQATDTGFHVDRLAVSRSPLYATSMGKAGERTLKETAGQVPVEKLPEKIPDERNYLKYPGGKPGEPVKKEEEIDRSLVVKAAQAFEDYQKGEESAGEVFLSFPEAVRQGAVEDWQSEPIKRHIFEAMRHPGLVHKGLGEHGYRNAETGEKKPATLLDAPHAPMSHGDFEMEFETTALAIDGKQAGTYYGSVGWGLRRTDAKVEPVHLHLISRGVPSDDFKGAVKVWNASTALRSGILREDTGFYRSPEDTTPITMLNKGAEVRIKGSSKGATGTFYEVSNSSDKGYVKESAVTGKGIPVIPLPEPWNGEVAGRQGIDAGEQKKVKRTGKKPHRRARIAIIHDQEEVKEESPSKATIDIQEVVNLFDDYQKGNEEAGEAFLRYNEEVQAGAVKKWVEINRKHYRYPGVKSGTDQY